MYKTAIDCYPKPKIQIQYTYTHTQDNLDLMVCVM